MAMIKSENISVTAREIDFVTSFTRNFEALRTIMGVSKPVKKTNGALLKKKRAKGVLENGAVAEGNTIPFSSYEVKEIPFKEMTIEKYAKAVSIESIKDHGYDVAVQMTDEEFKYDLIDKVTGTLYAGLNEGRLANTYATFQMALAMAKGLVENKWKQMKRNMTGIVGFVNTLDFSEYLGNANITVQTSYGFTYIKDFLGYNTIFLVSSGEVARGKVIATPTANIVPYYIDPSDSDFAKAGLEYRTDAESRLVGFHTQGNYNNASSEEFAILGLEFNAEYIDGIAICTFGGASIGLAPHASGSVLGKNVSDLQSNVVIGDTDIAGVLKYVTGYTGFSGDPAEQEGNYIALQFTQEDGATTTIQVIGRDRIVTLDSDADAVVRVTSNDDFLKVVSTKNGKVSMRIFSFAGLKLEAEA